MTGTVVAVFGFVVVVVGGGGGGGAVLMVLIEGDRGGKWPSLDVGAALTLTPTYVKRRLPITSPERGEGRAGSSR